MPLDPKLLRKLFAGGAVVAVLVAAGFYLHGILGAWRQRANVPKSIPDNVAQSAKGFTFSKSDGEKMLFTIHAATFQQFKGEERYELHDASIVLYGRDGGRSDKISGSVFQYDHNTGNVTASGEVQIDLEANSPVANPTNSSPARETKSAIHLQTSGLTFNEKTGIAETKERIEFRVPDASGSALGAIYDSHGNTLALKSAVKIVTTGRQKATITGQNATILRNPQRIVLQGARIEQPPRTLATDKLTVLLRADNTVDRILGAGGVHAIGEGQKGFDVSAPQGELIRDGASQLRSGTLSGGVFFASRGDSPAEGKAGRILLSFGAKGRAEKARVEDSVVVKQGPAGRSQQIEAAAVDLYLREGKIVEKAVTSTGPAQIVLTQGPTKSTISAGQFEAKFNEQNRLRSVFGSPNATIVSSTPSQPDRVTSSREVTATFNAKGEITSAEQTGDFHFQEGERKGWAERARYVPADESYVLAGSPRVQDSDFDLTADNIQLSRKTAGASAQGNVKTTYNQKAQSNGAMLGSAEPVHVTGATMTASRGSGVARYTSARMSRGPDIVEAPTILFDKAHRSLQAQGDTSGRVASVFVQTDKKGKATPVNVTADKLIYVDSDRKAVYSGNVLVRIEGATVTADTVQVLLLARRSQGDSQTGSQLDRIVAQGDIQIQQPDRRAKGSQLAYTAQEEKFVLTGSQGQPPSIFDAERGQISGDSLTFFIHDGRVLVGSGESSYIQTQTKVQDASKK